VTNDTITTEVLIYGATPAGIAAARAASTMDRSVTLVQPAMEVGGVVAGGLARTDVMGREYVGGLSAEFFEAVSSHTRRNDLPPGGKRWDLQPKVARETFEDWIDRADCEHVARERLESVGVDEGRIDRITLTDGRAYSADVFVDATYEGDVMAGAGVEYVVGRESRDTYDEPLAGVHQNDAVDYDEETYHEPCTCLGGDRETHYLHDNQFGTRIPARDDAGELIDGVQRESRPEAGTGDDGVQAYCYRVPVTQRDDLRVPWPQPDDYDPDRYELLRRYIEAHPDISFSALVHLASVPNGKYDLNANGPVTIDYVGENWEYPEAEPERRREIEAEHESYQKGFLWFLANDPRVPEDLREEASSWGLCADEFVSNGHWPTQLYVREARRMRGAYVVTQRDIEERTTKPDSVAMGQFLADSHPVQRFEAEDGAVEEEGHFLSETEPYEIPYRSLTPRSEDCVNLLVPVCLSASHVAFGSIRMEPVFMALGHATGTAASLAAPDGTPVQDVDVERLQKRLADQGQVLSSPE
jgi:hypothetical protein